MSFVCEYVSEEDIKKYKLKELWLEYNPFKIKNEADEKKYQWSVNKKNGSFLILVKQEIMDHQPLNDYTWIFHCSDKNYEIKLKRGEASSREFKDTPFVVAWDLVKCFLEGEEVLLNDAVSVGLKQALMAYGYSGVRMRKFAPVCEFKFNF